MTDITIGQFFPGNSAIHKLDPRTKLLFTLGFMILIFTVHKPVGIAAAGILTALIIIFSGVPVRYYFKGLKPLLFIIVFTALLNLFFSPGEVLFTVPHTNLTVTDRGVELSAFMVLRLVILFASTSALTFTTSPDGRAGIAPSAAGGRGRSGERDRNDDEHCAALHSDVCRGGGKDQDGADRTRSGLYLGQPDHESKGDDPGADTAFRRRVQKGGRPCDRDGGTLLPRRQGQNEP